MKRTLLLFGLVGILTGGGIRVIFADDYEDEEEYEEYEEAAIEAVDEYDFNLLLKVPQVLDNTQSKGYRKFKLQKIVGKMYIQWREGGGFSIAFDELKNKNFKVRGVNVTYEGEANDSLMFGRLNWIGNNRTDVFKTPTLCFGVELRPSYAIGTGTEDNSFVLVLAGRGNSALKKSLGSRVATTFFGYASGTQGCGCAAYSHKSPTRRGYMCGATDIVDDVVATFGTWRAKWKGRAYCR